MDRERESVHTENVFLKVATVLNPAHSAQALAVKDGADKLTLEDNNCVFYFHVM